MTKSDILAKLTNPGLIAILRTNHPANLLDAIGALVEGGVTVMEITLTTPGAVHLIADAIRLYGDRILMGVGSVLTPEACRQAITAGAAFVVTPVLRPDVIRTCGRMERPILSGVFTPTECLTAYEMGSDLIKLFPASNVGPKYIREILAPLPMLQIVPTGGVTPENVAEFFAAGAVAVGAGSSLVSDQAIQTRGLEVITQRAREFYRAVIAARHSQATPKAPADTTLSFNDPSLLDASSCVK